MNDETWVMFDFLDAIERNVVPRSEAEALAEALERIALRSDGDVAHHDHAQRLARTRVDEYRSRHPKETQITTADVERALDGEMP